MKSLRLSPVDGIVGCLYAIAECFVIFIHSIWVRISFTTLLLPALKLGFGRAKVLQQPELF